MIKNYLLLVTIIIGFTQNTYAMTNLDSVKNEIINYHESGKYDFEVKQIIGQAQKKLKTLIQYNQSNNKKKLALVLDIDDTSLSTYNQLKQFNFANTDKIWSLIEANNTLPAILPTLSLYQYCIKHNVAVFFISARWPQYKKATIYALHKAGYTKFKGLYLLPENYKNSSFSSFKLNARKAIEAKGYTIIMSIGDQFSDLQGGAALYTYKLPNYMYGYA
jgi:predicted secreted acid phosphatase